MKLADEKLLAVSLELLALATEAFDPDVDVVIDNFSLRAEDIPLRWQRFTFTFDVAPI